MRSFESSPGFSLIEVMVASAILACAVLSVAQLVVAATSSTAGARGVGEAALLAWQKIDQLRSLAFAFDDAGLPVTDMATDTAVQPERAAGGTGLTPSGDGTLSRDTGGYVDYLDALGQSLGGGDHPPPGTRYRRRWAVELFGGNPDVLVLRARVLAAGRDDELASATTLRARRRP
ncbi:MAG TPA: prepilin-type N-terminal cleavage/methylation domain-containing protein [Vicinamibacterales bacterium]|nr:prepilin-type N-terminal cleavage/methylation domain-containing protein [Vicinamibacterales bacterium]